MAKFSFHSSNAGSSSSHIYNSSSNGSHVHCRFHRNGEPREGVSPLCSPSDLAQSGFSWSNLSLLIPESCLKESGNLETRRLQTHGSCSLPPSPSSQGEPSDPTQRNIHLPVHPSAEFFSPRKKGHFFNWRSQELVGSLPANHRCCGEGLIPLPPYPASRSITPVLTRLPSSWFPFILASTV
ncbi:hypothetical protein ILYODFUR_028561 [Ilyodon furcidens]|uniref:Uncharacterized protein n=1 Tax=Ilyodon furcidens TaxID=33524 RepID=A0ABV0VI11_9TELE